MGSAIYPMFGVKTKTQRVHNRPQTRPENAVTAAEKFDKAKHGGQDFERYFSRRRTIRSGRSCVFSRHNDEHLPDRVCE